MDLIEEILVETDGLTVSRLAFNRFKKVVPGMVEKIYSINSGLANTAPFIKAGTVVKIPIPVKTNKTKISEPVSFWS